MSKNTTFKRLLRPSSPGADDQKKLPPSKTSASGSSAPSDQAAPATDAAVQQIYTDLSVCRTLGIKRRVLAEARTAATRGRYWDAVGEEVGMTREWVYDYAVKNGIVPDFFGSGLEPVSGKYVSVRLIGTTPNKCLVQVELEATKKREFARTRNIMDHPIHYKEVFSCIRIMLPVDIHLEWIAAPNEMKY